jgi:hypothetical protein
VTPEDFEERRRDLETLLAELGHRLWESGIPAPRTAEEASSNEDTFVVELLDQLRNGATLSGRKSSALVAGILFRATEARLRTFASLNAHFSALERRSLAELLRLPAEERRTMGALLRLPDPERADLAIVLQLSDIEDEALAAFVDDREAATASAAAKPRPRDGGTRRRQARDMSG